MQKGNSNDQFVDEFQGVAIVIALPGDMQLLSLIKKLSRLILANSSLIFFTYNCKISFQSCLISKQNEMLAAMPNKTDLTQVPSSLGPSVLNGLISEIVAK